jgi:hypothetical protein
VSTSDCGYVVSDQYCLYSSSHSPDEFSLSADSSIWLASKHLNLCRWLIVLDSDICTYFHGEHAYRSGPKQGFIRSSHLVTCMLSGFLVDVAWPVMEYSAVQKLLIAITTVRHCRYCMYPVDDFSGCD